nr:MAG TPA: hypothetical protein [Caudoviricetes sp.]
MKKETAKSICRGCTYTINCINGLFCTKQKAYVEHKYHNSAGNGTTPPCYSLIVKNNEEGETLQEGGGEG